MRNSKSSMIADEVVRRCEGAETFTLQGGYAMNRALPGGRVCFPPSRTLAEKRNQAGRCTQYTGIYPDGSKIVFNYDSRCGRTTLKALAPGVAA